MKDIVTMQYLSKISLILVWKDSEQLFIRIIY